MTNPRPITETVEFLSEAEVAALLTADCNRTKPGFLDLEIARIRSGAPAEYRYVRYIPDDEPVIVPKEGWAR